MAQVVDEGGYVAGDLSLLQAIGLGILQGLTEFLPISSTGHLALLQFFWNIRDVPLFFDVMLHVGTLAAVLAFYGRSLLPQGSTNPQKTTVEVGPLPRLLLFLVVATLPAVAAAFLFRPTKLATNETFTTPQRLGDLREYSERLPGVVVSFLFCTGAILLAGANARTGQVDAWTMTWRHALVMGLAQACSVLFPGLSRSGMTVSTALLLGLRGEWAVHFSLLMSIPAVLGALALHALKLLRDDPAWFTTANITSTLAGTVASAIVGWFCIKMLLGAIRRGRWWWFTVYLWTLVAFVGAYLALQASVSNG